MNGLKKDKGFIITLILMIIAICLLLFYYISIRNENEELNGNDNLTSDNTAEKLVVDKTATRVDNYDLFVSLNKYINDYYDNILLEDKSALLNTLDENYISSKQITTNNINEIFKTDYSDFDFVSLEIYFRKVNNSIYYFINGNLKKYSFYEEMLYTDDCSLILIVDQNNKSYSILPIAYQENIGNYANEYEFTKIKNIDLNNYNHYIVEKYTDDYIIADYIIYYKELLYLNTEKAYSMLTDNMKVIYPTLEDFSNNLSVIYDQFSTNLLSYGSKESDDSIVYSGITKEGVAIYFYDKNIMDFTVEIK